MHKKNPSKNILRKIHPRKKKMMQKKIKKKIVHKIHPRKK